jgi:hypothetical protein
MKSTIFNPESLQHYMFTKNHIMKLFIDEKTMKHVKKEEIENKETKIKIVIDNTFIVPTDKDKLFWCYYILMNGVDNYSLLDTKKFVEEKKSKINLVEKLRLNKDILKKNKWKKNAIEADLVYSEEISTETFMCICAISNINVMILKNRCLYTIEDMTCDDIQIIEHRSIGFGCNLLDKKEMDAKYNNYCTSFWKTENIKKPLQSISSYKIASLHDICKKLKLPIKNIDGKKIKKKDLYESIKSNI